MLKDQKNVIAALLLSVGIVLCGFFMKTAINNFKDKDRVVSVKGLAEKEVVADHVIMPLTYKEIGNDLQSIYKCIEDKNKTIINFLISKGINKSEISMSAPEIIDLKADRYSSSNQVENRYTVTAIITVSSNKVDIVRELTSKQGDLLNQGIAIIGDDYKYVTEYQFTKLNDVKPQMIQDATKNARAAAEKFAADSDSKLGKIRTADQGLFSISDRDSYTPHIKKIRVVTTVDYYLND